jgi:Sulfatase
MRRRLETTRAKVCMTVAAFVLALSAATVSAQEVLPRSDPKFGGVIGQTNKESTPAKIPLIKAPSGAPNVLLILIDDSGFGQWGTFGGQILTPNLKQLAKDGLSYARVHTTGLCSPTRPRLVRPPPLSSFPRELARLYAEGQNGGLA